MMTFWVAPQKGAPFAVLFAIAATAVCPPGEPRGFFERRRKAAMDRCMIKARGEKISNLGISPSGSFESYDFERILAADAD